MCCSMGASWMLLVDIAVLTKLNRTTHVPVGEDQTQHLEFTRDCVDTFNSTYGEVFVKPQILLCP